MLKVYAYQGCSTCRNAIKWLKTNAVTFTEIPIRETPPSIPELQFALRARAGELRPLLNTSGTDYRALNLKEKLPTMAEPAVLKLLSENGNLVKRPFVIDEAAGISLMGFRETEWSAALG